VEASGEKASELLAWWKERRQPKSTGKRWVRQEEPAPEKAAVHTTTAPAVVEVKDFTEIDALLQAAPETPHDGASQDQVEASAGEA